MKTRYVVLPIILAGVLSAQGRQFKGESLTPPTPQQLVERKVNFLTMYFTLTSSQVTAITGIVTTEQTCLTADSTNMQTAREGLVSAIKTGNPTIATAVANIASAEAAEETCRATAAAAIYADLTPAQQAKVGTGLGPLLGGGGRRGPPHPGH